MYRKNDLEVSPWELDDTSHCYVCQFLIMAKITVWTSLPSSRIYQTNMLADPSRQLWQGLPEGFQLLINMSDAATITSPYGFDTFSAHHLIQQGS